MKKIIYSLIAIFIVFGCSSLPKYIETQTFIDANRTMRYAHKNEALLNYEKALNLYVKAYNLYTQIDNVEGKINAGLSIARAHYYLGNSEDYEDWLNNISFLIDQNRKSMKPARDLFLIEIAFYEEDYEKVLKILKMADNIKTDNIEWKTERLCYRAMSLQKLGMDYTREFKDIESNIKKLKKAYNKNKLADPSVYSYAYYVTGYLYIKEENWSTALLNFKQAREIDVMLENIVNLADDVYAIASCYENLNKIEKAKSFYLRAAEIYLQLGNLEMAERAGEKAAEIEH